MPKENHPEYAPLILCASPRAGGNSDSICRILAEELDKKGYTPSILFLRDYPITPCTGCDNCLRVLHNASAANQEELRRFGCPFSTKDAAAPLLQQLLDTPFLCVVSPIYMYHLPAHFKALLDRTQPFWHLQTAKIASAAMLQPRPCFTVFLAARAKGNQIFTGATLSLRYALRPMGFFPGPNLELRGLDGQTAFVQNEAAIADVCQYATDITTHLKTQYA